MQRRAFGALATGMVALGSGCSGQDRRNTRRTSCRHPIETALGKVEITGTEYGELSLQQPVVRSNRLEFELLNTAETGSLRTESSELYDIQKRTGGDWTSVYCVSPEKEWNRNTTWHDPGAGFSWTFAVEDGGIEDSRDGVTVEKDVSRGEYRFVYFGLVEPRLEGTEDASNKAVSIRFTID